MILTKVPILSLAIATVLTIGITTAFADYSISSTDAVAKPTATAVPATTNINTIDKLAPPAKPITSEALPKYWAMGALDINGVPYLPLIKTANDLGYTVDVESTTDPQVENCTEYTYEIKKADKSICIGCVSIQYGAIISNQMDGSAYLVHDWNDRNTVNYAYQNDTTYMPAQFFKEALDSDNILP